MAARARVTRSIDLQSEPAPKDPYIGRTPTTVDIKLGVRDIMRLSLGMRTTDRLQGSLAFGSIAIFALAASATFAAISIAADGGYLATMLTAAAAFLIMLTAGMTFNWHTVERIRRSVTEATASSGRTGSRRSRRARKARRRSRRK